VAIPAGRLSAASDWGMRRSNQDAVEAFVIDRREVMVAEYAACVRAGRCAPAKTGGSCNTGVAGRAKHPINCVDWSQATA